MSLQKVGFREISEVVKPEMKSVFSISDRDDHIPAVNPFPVLTSPQGKDSNTQKPDEGTIHHSPLNASITSKFKLCSKPTAQMKQKIK